MKNIISKGKFCEILKQIEDKKKLGIEMNSLLSRYDNDITNEFYHTSKSAINFEKQLVELLKIMFNDFEDDIYYFIYEFDFGKKWFEEALRVDGMNVDISSAEKLYDYLLLNLKNN